MSEFVMVKRELQERVLCLLDELEPGDWSGTQQELSDALAQEAGCVEPVAWLYKNTNMGNELSLLKLDHYYRPYTPAGEHDYVQGIPLYTSPPPQHPILKVLNDPQAMELVALKATVAQQAQLIEWMKKGSPKQEPVAYMRNEVTPNNLVKCTFTCPGAFGVYRNPPAPVSVATPELDPAFEAWWESDGQYCRSGGGSYEKTFAYRAYEAAIDKVKELNQ